MPLKTIREVKLSDVAVFREGSFIDKNETDSMVALFKSLDPDEYTILKILIQSPCAISVKQIRRFIISSVLKHQSKELEKNELFRKAFSDKFVKYLDILSKNILKLTERRMIENLNMLKKLSNAKDNGIILSFPAYESIKNRLITLEKMGLVNKRIVEKKKASELWYVNPSFTKLYMKSIKSLEGSKKPIDVWSYQIIYPLLK